MSTIERPGINSKWLKRMKTWHRGSMAEWWKDIYPYQVNNLEYYIKQGVVPDRPCRRKGSDGKWEELKPGDTQMGWASCIDGELPLYNLLRLFEFERLGSTEGKAHWILASHIFAAFYIEELITLHLGDSFQVDRTPFVALGIVVGCKEQAFQLASRRIAYFSNPRVTTTRLRKHTPIFHFMMQLLADYLNEAPHLLKPIEEPIDSTSMVW